MPGPGRPTIPMTAGLIRPAGGSRILDPFGQTLAEAGVDETLLVADLDYEAVKRARYRLPTLRDSNLDLIRRELNRLSAQVGVPPESRRL